MSRVLPWLVLVVAAVFGTVSAVTVALADPDVPGWTGIGLGLLVVMTWQLLLAISGVDK